MMQRVDRSGLEFSDSTKPRSSAILL